MNKSIFVVTVVGIITLAMMMSTVVSFDVLAKKAGENGKPGKLGQNQPVQPVQSG